MIFWVWKFEWLIYFGLVIILLESIYISLVNVHTTLTQIKHVQIIELYISQVFCVRSSNKIVINDNVNCTSEAPDSFQQNTIWKEFFLIFVNWTPFMKIFMKFW